MIVTYGLYKGTIPIRRVEDESGVTQISPFEVPFTHPSVASDIQIITAVQYAAAVESQNNATRSTRRGK